MKSSNDYKRAYDFVQSAINDWDPYELLKNGAPNDEFSSLALSLVAHVPRIQSTEDAIHAVSQVFSEAFEPELFQPDSCREVGAKIYGALQSEGYI